MQLLQQLNMQLLRTYIKLPFTRFSRAYYSQSKSTNTQKTQKIPGYLQRLYDGSKKTLTPFFTIDSEMIEIIHDPLDFYIALIRGVRSAVNRIGFSSLYLGNGSLQRYLLKSIGRKLQSVPYMKVRMLFDYNRSKRKDNGDSSMDLLQQFEMQQEGRNLKVGYLRNGVLFGLAGEVAGVHHQKIYMFDNRCIISGANLSTNYFLNRKDRYMQFRQCPELCNYFFDYLQLMADVHTIPEKGYIESLRESNKKLSANGVSKFKTHFGIWKYSYQPTEYLDNIHNQQKELKRQRDKLEAEKQRKIVVPFEDEMENKVKSLLYFNRNQEIAKILSTSIEMRTRVPEAQRHAKRENVRKRLFGLKDENWVNNQLELIQQPEGSHLAQKGDKVYVFPFIHFPFLAQTAEPAILENIIRCAHQNHHPIRISSGYMNFPDKLAALLAQSDKGLDVLCSAPQANSFYRAGWIKGYIPYFYRFFERRLLTRFPGFRFWQFNNREWSFHMKGIWIEESESSYLTVIGSSNYNMRSQNKDTQLQLYLYSTCPKFDRRLNQEWTKAKENCQLVTAQEIDGHDQIKLTWFVKAMACLFRKFA